MSSLSFILPSYFLSTFLPLSLSLSLSLPTSSFPPFYPPFLPPYFLLPSLLPPYYFPSLSPLLPFLLSLSINKLSISISHHLTLFFITSHMLRVTYDTVLHVRAPLPGTLDLILSSGRWGVCGFPSGLLLSFPSLPSILSFFPALFFSFFSGLIIFFFFLHRSFLFIPTHRSSVIDLHHIHTFLLSIIYFNYHNLIPLQL